jgi:transmembrane sensor
MNERDVWRLIARLQSGEATASEEAALREWSRDPENAELLRQVKKVWDLAGESDREWDVDAAWSRVAAQLDEPNEARLRLVPSGGRATRRPRRGRWLMAAGGLLAASIALIVFVRGPVPSAPAPLVFATDASGGETAHLPDGTLVRLGPSSRLVVRGERAVELSGLAFFAVEHDPARPFEIMLPTGAVRVLGTRFEVRATSDSARVSVIEGRVEVKGATEAIELTSGEATAVARGGEPLRVESVVPETVATWMGRTLVFQRTTLSEAAAEIESMYDVRVQVAPALQERTLTALFTDEPLDRLVSTMCRAVVARCTVTDTLVMVEAQE